MTLNSVRHSAVRQNNQTTFAPNAPGSQIFAFAKEAADTEMSVILSGTRRVLTSLTNGYVTVLSGASGVCWMGYMVEE